MIGRALHIRESPISGRGSKGARNEATLKSNIEMSIWVDDRDSNFACMVFDLSNAQSEI